MTLSTAFQNIGLNALKSNLLQTAMILPMLRVIDADGCRRRSTMEMNMAAKLENYRKLYKRQVRSSNV
jgi:hypothetical protein